MVDLAVKPCLCYFAINCIQMSKVIGYHISHTEVEGDSAYASLDHSAVKRNPYMHPGLQAAQIVQW